MTVTIPVYSPPTKVKSFASNRKELTNNMALKIASRLNMKRETLNGMPPTRRSEDGRVKSSSGIASVSYAHLIMRHWVSTVDFEHASINMIISGSCVTVHSRFDYQGIIYVPCEAVFQISHANGISTLSVIFWLCTRNMDQQKKPDMSDTTVTAGRKSVRLRWSAAWCYGTRTTAPIQNRGQAEIYTPKQILNST